MPRTAAALDVFQAIAEPKRRRVLGLLIEGDRSVNEIVTTLKCRQPQVSKSLGVLRQAGLVSVRHDGRQRFYRVNGERLKPVHDWALNFESFWEHQLDRIKTRAEARARKARPAKPLT